jgi:dTDP-4-amino-4,6-dideoxygalactose transaminase
VQVPFIDLNRLHHPLRPKLDAAYRRVMDAGLFIMGPELAAFESEFAAYSEVRHCIGVGNGLDALHLTLRATGIGPGDEVIVPSNTFIATWLAVEQCGAVIVPVEPDVNTHNINTDCISGAITPRTRAIIPVHLYGQPVDMDPINELATQHGLIVIEDAAQAQGARYKGRRVGSLGHAAATSFYPAKNLGALGDGGAVLTNDDVIAEKARLLRNYGSMVKYKHELLGHNSRLDELQAAFLREKLKVLDESNARRREIAAVYSSLLIGNYCILPIAPEYADPVWHLYVIQSQQRDALKAHLEAQDISTVIHYPTPPHRQTCYSHHAYGPLPVAEALANQVLSLPMSPDLKEQEIIYVCQAVRSFFDNRR